MRLLLDENVPINLRKELKRVGHNVEHINFAGKGMTDEEVLSYALKEKRTLISLDADFCHLKKMENYGIIKINSKLSNKINILIELLSIIKNMDMKDIYIQIDENKAYIEEKVYSKKKHKFKHYYKRPLNLTYLKENHSI